MARLLKLPRKAAVGFIDWLGPYLLRRFSEDCDKAAFVMA